MRSSIARPPVPADWAVTQIGNLCSTAAGGKLGLTKGDYKEEGTPAFSAAGQDGYVDATEFTQPGVILSAIGARCGKCFFADRAWTTLANVQAIVPDESKLNTRYLWYYVNDEGYWHRSGSAQPFIKPSTVKDAWLALPPLPEQKKIAEILGSVDDAMRATEAVIEQTRRVKEGLLQANMGSSAYDEAEMSHLCEWIGVGIASATTGAYRSHGVPLLRSLNIRDGGQWDFTRMRFIDEAFDVQNRTRRVQAGDVLCTRTGANIGLAAVVPPEYAGAQSFTTLILRPRVSRIIPDYLCLWLNSPLGKKTIADQSAGGAQANLNVGWISKFKLRVPSRDVQLEFVRRFAALELSERRNVSIVAAAQQIKSGLLQDLLTGKVRTKP